MSEKILEWITTTHIPYQSVELSKAFLTFLMFSLIGWICEVLYVGIFFEHRFINRGFLHGPLCPIYGFGGIVILSLPKCLQNPIWVLFLSGLFFCSLVEYIGSWILEKMFHTHWWDYSNKKIKIGEKTIPLNLNGRICLLNSLLFGIMTVAVIDFVQPLVGKFFNLFSDITLIIASDVLSIVLIIDLGFTIHKLVDFSIYFARLKDFSETVKDRFENESWFKNSSISERINSVHERVKTNREEFSDSFISKLDELNKHQKNAEFFIKKFSSMSSRKYKELLIHSKQKNFDSFNKKKTFFKGKKNV